MKMPRIILTSSQWRRISEITGSFGLLSMGSVTIPALLDKTDPIHVVLGLIVAFISWLGSVFAAKKY